MQDIAAFVILTFGVLYYIFKYKFLYIGIHKTVPNFLFGILLCIDLILLTVFQYDASITTDTTTALVFSILGGSLFDLYTSSFPGRGSWSIVVALLFVLKDVYNFYLIKSEFYFTTILILAHLCLFLYLSSSKLFQAHIPYTIISKSDTVSIL